jgi:hypothetical protein
MLSFQKPAVSLLNIPSRETWLIRMAVNRMVLDHEKILNPNFRAPKAHDDPRPGKHGMVLMPDRMVIGSTEKQ